MPAWQDKQPEPQRPVTLQDIFFWIQHVDEQVKRLSQVESATEKVYSQTRNKVDAMYRGFESLEESNVALEMKIDTLTGTCINMMKRLNILIDMQERNSA